MITSPHGVAFVQAQEWVPRSARCGWDGKRYYVYKDYAGYRTIGCGHLVRPNESFSAGLTEEQVTALLAADLAPVERAIAEHVAPVLEQHQFDALASFGFNCGAGALEPENCTFIRLLNRGYMTAPLQLYGLPAWNKVHGKADANLSHRRAAECHLWVTPWPDDPVELDAALFDLVALLRESSGTAHA